MKIIYLKLVPILLDIFFFFTEETPIVLLPVDVLYQRFYQNCLIEALCN